MRVIRVLLVTLLGVWGGMAVFRSGVFLTRIINGTINIDSRYYPEIKACGQKPLEMERLIVWQYRNLGVECDKH